MCLIKGDTRQGLDEISTSSDDFHENHEHFHFYDPIQLSAILEIFSLDVKRYDKKTKFIHYVVSKKDQTSFTRAFNEYNFELMKRVKQKNEYLKLGFSKI